MELTWQARAWVARMRPTHPDEVDRWVQWAARIAKAYGHAKIGKDDLEAASRCAGEEFLPR